MTTYQIRNRGTDDVFTVEADSYMAAAAAAATKINPKYPRIGVIRQSGESDKSGIFQGTVQLGEGRGSEVTSTVGPQFSVT